MCGGCFKGGDDRHLCEFTGLDMEMTFKESYVEVRPPRPNLPPAARVRVGAKGAPSFASARDAEALLRADLIALAAEPAKPTVRVVENGSNLALDDAKPEKTQAQKKAAVTSKLMGHLMGRR